MSSSAFYGVLGTILLLYVLDAYFCRRRHPQEPQYVRPKVPLVGHLLGLAMYGSKYYEIISPGQPELFTLPIFSFRLYVLNSRHLFPVITRNARTLSFQPFTKIASKVWCDASDHFMEMHEDGHAWIRDFYRDTRTALSPGEGLDYQNLMAGESLQRLIEALDRQLGTSGNKNFKLYEWIHHLLSVATTDGVYGKNNPFRDRQVEKDFWIWMGCMKKLTAKMPRTLMTKEIQARDRLFKAFEAYWISNWSDAAEVTKARKHLYDREGVSPKDQAGNQASFNIALLGNTVPTAFWALYDIISRLELLKNVRKELEDNAVARIERVGNPSITLEVAALRTKCPLLLSSYQETQRTRSINANIRQALSDTVIESPTTATQYLLAKGQYIQMPSGPIHKDRSIWGPTAAEYDPYRFIKENAVTRKGESYAFMPWGSAPHLCPARQFASTEILLFVALMVLRFEFAPAGGSDRGWKDPKDKTGEISTIMPPRDEVLVNISRRDGWQGEWSLKMGDSSKRIPLASG